MLFKDIIVSTIFRATCIFCTEIYVNCVIILQADVCIIIKNVSSIGYVIFV